MTSKVYFLEIMSRLGSWSILCESATNGASQGWLRHYRTIYPQHALRVVEQTADGRALVMCEGGT